MPMYDRYCYSCHETMPDCYEAITSNDIPCPCGGVFVRVMLPTKRAVIGDEIDVDIKNGLCHADGTPRHFSSREELKRAEKAAGWTNAVQHIGAQGSDKSKHTVRWVSVSPISEEERLRNWHEHESSLTCR